MKKEQKIFLISAILLIAILAIIIINYINSPKPGELKQITYSELQELINNQEDFILIVSQSTCSHCMTYKPKVKKISEEYGIITYYMDYDLEEEKETFMKDFNFHSGTPTTLFFKNGKETSILNRLEGDLGESKIIEKFKEMGFIEE